MIVAAISQTPSSGDTDRAIRSYGVNGCVFEVKDNRASGPKWLDIHLLVPRFHVLGGRAPQ
jgi:hypothetical protein